MRTVELPDRFWNKVSKDVDGCWRWTGCLKSTGYGQFRLEARTQRAHRLSYESLVGPIPEGLQLDHLCRVRSCVNPDHMEPVTSAENTRRGFAAEANRLRRAANTHCLHGHKFDDENTYVDREGKRKCRACDAHRKRLYRKKLSPRPRG